MCSEEYLEGYYAGRLDAAHTLSELSNHLHRLTTEAEKAGSSPTTRRMRYFANIVLHADVHVHPENRHFREEPAGDCYR